MKKNFALGFCTALFFFLAFVAFFPEKKDTLLDEALRAFLQKDLVTAENALYKVEKEKPSYSLFPYRGYIALAKGDCTSADLFFQKALSTTNQEKEAFVVLCAKGYSLYLQNRIGDILPFLEKAKRCEPGAKEALLLEALYFYGKKEYAAASRLFTSYHKSEAPYSDEWLFGLISQCFPESTIDVSFAHCLIEEGKFDAAQELLENHLETSSLARLYLAYKYLKEGALRPSEKKSYLNIALCYFKRTADHNIEKQSIASKICEELSSLFKEEDTTLAFSFTHLLEKWESEDCLDNVATAALNKAISNDEKKGLAFCTAVREEFEGRAFHKLLLDKLIAQFTSDLKNRAQENPFALYSRIEALSSTIPTDLRLKITNGVKGEIISLLQSEKDPFPNSNTYLGFWKTLAKDEEKNAFARTLLESGMLFWRKENEENKGSAVLNMALNLADARTKKEFSAEIGEFFLALYTQAKNANIVERLSRIYDAMHAFKIGVKGLLSKEESANYLADAAYLFSIHKYHSAQIGAEWVAKIDEKNEEAFRLAGLSSFHLGNYHSAISYLSQLTAPDEEAKEALKVALTHFSDHAIAGCEVASLD